MAWMILLMKFDDFSIFFVYLCIQSAEIIIVYNNFIS